jgi:hypothetical protein
VGDIAAVFATSVAALLLGCGRPPPPSRADDHASIPASCHGDVLPYERHAVLVPKDGEAFAAFQVHGDRFLYLHVTTPTAGSGESVLVVPRVHDLVTGVDFPLPQACFLPSIAEDGAGVLCVAPQKTGGAVIERIDADGNPPVEVARLLHVPQEPVRQVGGAIYYVGPSRLILRAQLDMPPVVISEPGAFALAANGGIVSWLAPGQSGAQTNLFLAILNLRLRPLGAVGTPAVSGDEVAVPIAIDGEMAVGYLNLGTGARVAALPGKGGAVSFASGKVLVVAEKQRFDPAKELYLDDPAAGTQTLFAGGRCSYPQAQGARGGVLWGLAEPGHAYGSAIYWSPIP